MVKSSSISPLDDEEAVRRYLIGLTDPEKLVDTAEVERLRASLDTAADPIERLLLLSAIERASSVDLSALEQAFVARAAVFAAANGVSRAAFAALGVPARVLSAANIGTRPVTPAPRRTGPARSRVSSGAVAAHVPPDRFTAGELAASASSTVATARKVIADLLEAGLVVEVDPPEDWTGRGRVPTFYQRVGK